MTLPDPTVWQGSKRSVRVSFTAIRYMDGEAHARLFTKGYSQLYAAKIWLRTMTGDIEGVRFPNELRLDDGIKIRCFELDQVMSYELNAEEAKWRPDEADLRMIARFRRGIWEIPDEPVATGDVAVVTQKVRTVKEQKASLPAGYVTVTALCKGTPVPPTIARALLRASNYAKPAYGWAFGPGDLPDVKKLIGLS